MIKDYVDQKELKQLISGFLAVVGLIALAAVFGFIVVPGLRNANKPEAPPSVTPPEGQAGWLDPGEYPPTKGYVIPPLDPKTILTATPALLAQGKELFAPNCAPCHGAAGEGNGPAGGGLNPAPRNFTKPDGWKNGYQIPEIFRTLTDGVPGTAMASYSYLSPKDRMALVHYVQSLGAFQHGPDDGAAMAALSKELASSGVVVPNKIPVSMAMAKLEQEYRAARALQPPEGAEGLLFRRGVWNPSLAAATLAQTPGWRQSPQALAREISAGVPSNGFNPAALTFTGEEWKRFHLVLVSAAR
jgi:mono/diheme cytochrome c family protein